MEGALLLFNNVTSCKELFEEGKIISESHFNVRKVVEVAKMRMDHPKND